MKYPISIYILLLLLTLPGQSLHAEITLPDVLGSSMVLQRHQRVPIWGRAAPGEAVRVSFLGQVKTTVADAEGQWKVWLDPMEANAVPNSLQIAGGNTLQLDSVLVGEVWLCTGQSNMQWSLKQLGEREANTIAQADYPNIRLFNVSRLRAFKKREGPIAQWQVCSPETVPGFSAVGFHFGRILYETLGIPIGLINSAYGGSQAEAWTPVEYLAASPDLQPTIARGEVWAVERPTVQATYDRDLEAWQAVAEAAKAKGEEPPYPPTVPDALRDYRIAASIYDNMIAPLIPYAIRGALWYQGESNEERAEQYGLLLPTMIRAWRERWGQGDFPFGIIQLPNYRAVADTPTDEPWSHVREVQRRTALSDPNTGLIVTIDLGEADDIHPGNKLDVGKRSARWALTKVYGQPGIGSGPVLREAKVGKGKITLYFDQVGKGLQTCDGRPLSEFAIAGADQRWHWAEAKIEGKNKVVVWSPKVPSPKAVRYAFNINPVRPNLSNDSCLPASPFRTDDWPDPTAGKR